MVNFSERMAGIVPEDLIVDEFFSTVPGNNVRCIISTRTKSHNPLEKFSTSSEVPQTNNDLPSTR